MHSEDLLRMVLATLSFILSFNWLQDFRSFRPKKHWTLSFTRYARVFLLGRTVTALALALSLLSDIRALSLSLCSVIFLCTLTSSYFWRTERARGRKK